MTKFLPFVFDEKGLLTNQKCFIITGKHVEYLTAFFNSSLFKYCFRENFPELQGGTRELSKVFFDKIPVLKISDHLNIGIKKLIQEIQELTEKNESTKEIELKIDNIIFDIYSLSYEEKSEIEFIETQ